VYVYHFRWKEVAVAVGGGNVHDEWELQKDAAIETNTVMRVIN
jgi:hypothetical protein